MRFFFPVSKQIWRATGFLSKSGLLSALIPKMKKGHGKLSTVTQTKLSPIRMPRASQLWNACTWERHLPLTHTFSNTDLDSWLNYFCFIAALAPVTGLTFPH